jgi:hypothetical protein
MSSTPFPLYSHPSSVFTTPDIAKCLATPSQIPGYMINGIPIPIILMASGGIANTLKTQMIMHKMELKDILGKFKPLIGSDDEGSGRCSLSPGRINFANDFLYTKDGQSWKFLTQSALRSIMQSEGNIHPTEDASTGEKAGPLLKVIALMDWPHDQQYLFVNYNAHLKTYQTGSDGFYTLKKELNTRDPLVARAVASSRIFELEKLEDSLDLFIYFTKSPIGFNESVLRLHSLLFSDVLNPLFEDLYFRTKIIDKPLFLETFLALDESKKSSIFLSWVKKDLKQDAYFHSLFSSAGFTRALLSHPKFLESLFLRDEKHYFLTLLIFNRTEYAKYFFQFPELKALFLEHPLSVPRLLETNIGGIHCAFHVALKNMQPIMQEFLKNAEFKARFEAHPNYKHAISLLRKKEPTSTSSPTMSLPMAASAGVVPAGSRVGAEKASDYRDGTRHEAGGGSGGGGSSSERASDTKRVKTEPFASPTLP